MYEAIRNLTKVRTIRKQDLWMNLGDVLLVGEGNLSFSNSLLFSPQSCITHMTATTLEEEKQLSEKTYQNAKNLRRRGVIVLHGVDATELEKTIKPCHFDTIIFQFPNVGSRETKYGHNPNHVLIRRFLKSAAPFLKSFGKVIISAVYNSYYEGAFQFEEAAEFAGYELPEIYPFDPLLFSGYSHTNTNSDESAIEEHNQFATWVFRLKK